MITTAEKIEELEIKLYQARLETKVYGSTFVLGVLVFATIAWLHHHFSMEDLTLSGLLTEDQVKNISVALFFGSIGGALVGEIGGMMGWADSDVIENKLKFLTEEQKDKTFHSYILENNIEINVETSEPKKKKKRGFSHQKAGQKKRAKHLR